MAMAVNGSRDEAADGNGTGAEQRDLLVGLLADPGLPTALAEQLAETLPGVLENTPEEGTRYRFVVVSETLRRLGDAHGERLIDFAAERAEQEGWDFALCLTDMPLHDSKQQPLVAELSRSAGAAVLAVPALNVLKLAAQSLDIVAGIVLELAAREEPVRGPLRRRLESQARGLHPVEPDDKDVDLQVTRSVGPLWILAGMVRVNRP
ncbi:MAG: hypothetical protein QOC83_4324, partial [Pseudonocardiales bacterium]|nr:hypothetical protein [Pseudonocardiales bacterium]